jgi:hypothetical protein
MIRNLVYLLLFATGFMVGGLFPSYSVQYQQRVQAQYDQISIDLAPFQEIANKRHNGSMAALIQHHLNSSDPTFHDEGLAIGKMVDNYALLQASVAASKLPLAEQLLFLARQGDKEIATATWQNFSPALITTQRAILFALASGLICCLLTWLCWTLLKLPFRHLHRPAT